MFRRVLFRSAQIPLLEAQYRAALSALRAGGVELLDAERLAPGDRALAEQKFLELMPLLAPQTIAHGRPLPFLRSREQYVIALLGRGKDRAIGLVPTTRLPKCFVLPAEGAVRLIPTAELVRAFAADLFPKGKTEETAVVRVTRSAEINAGDLLDDTDADFRAVMERLLRERRRLEPVRAQISASASDRMVEAVRASLKLPKKRVFRYAMPLDLSFVRQLGGDVIPDRLCRHVPEPQRTVHLKKGEYFDFLARRELLVALPYQRIDPFVDLLYEAADAPDVRAVHITLYRLAGSSRIAAALSYAASRGKRVVCLLELRARFDEQNNIDYSRMLEQAGCEIRYGLPDCKVHAKLCLIERVTPAGMAYYTQIGTGNYNESTAEQYTDLMLLTADPAVGRDAAKVFDALERGELPGLTERLILCPRDFKPWLLQRIGEQAALGSHGCIRIQCNSMNDPEIMDALAAAAQSGAEVELFLRGICCLRPDVPGVSEGLVIRSVIGQYLEHQRIYAFGRGAQTRVFFGSGDLLERNTMRRVEAFVEARSAPVKEELLAILEFLRRDDRKAWTMLPDGWYVRPEPRGRFSSQQGLQAYFASRVVEKPAPAPEPESAPRTAPPAPEPVRAMVPVLPPAAPKKRFWQRVWQWLKEN